jgi:hypothetical protein
MYASVCLYIYIYISVCINCLILFKPNNDNSQDIAGNLGL